METRLASSLRVTAAIQAFCDFGVQLLGYISETTKDHSHVDAGDHFIDTGTTQLIRVEKKLRENSVEGDAVHLVAEERLLENLRSSCHAIAKVLFIRLRQLKDPKGQQSQAKRQWIKEDAETLEKRLISFRETLQSAITPWLL